MKNLKKILKEKGLTQKQLSQLTNISQKQISQYANSKAMPLVINVQKIMKVLNVSFEQLYGEAKHERGNFLSRWFGKTAQRVL